MLLALIKDFRCGCHEGGGNHPRKEVSPKISNLRDDFQSIFRPILTRVQVHELVLYFEFDVKLDGECDDADVCPES